MTRKTFLTRRAGRRGAVALLALLGPAGAASAASYTVLNNGSAGADTLRGVLAQAALDGDASDTITFAPNVTGTIALGGTELVLGKSLTIVGPGANVLTLDAGGSSRVFKITAGTVAISGLTIAHGNRDSGGGLYSDFSSTLTVTACTFSGNSATYYGGGLYSDGTAIITACTFSGNTALYGGGLFNDGTMTLTGSTFSGDTAAYYGGGLFNDGTVTLTGSTFSGNSATYGGGGLFNNGGTATVTATLFAGNTSGDIDGSPITSGGSNLLGDGDGNGFTNGVNHDRTGVANAMLGALAFNGGHTQTIALLAGSPAIDADYSTSTATDQRGFARPVGVRGDIGAYEFGASAPVTLSSVTISAASASVSVGGTDQFTATAAYSDGTTADVTHTALWSSDNTAAATISAGGLATGVAEGTAGITAALGGVTSASVTLVVPHAPALLVVTNALDDGSAGCLRAVLGAAGPGDTVTFAPNVTGTITLAGNEIGIFFQDVTILGPGADVLAINADSASRVFEIQGGMVAISGLTIENGNDAGDGGGLYNGGGTVTVTDCAFLDDAAGSLGGGLYNDFSSTLTVTACTFSGNTATYYGGGLYSDGTLTVTGSTFSGDTAALYGGGLFNDGTMTLTGSTFSGNSADYGGGGLYSDGTATVTATLFAGSTPGDVDGSSITSGGSNLLGDGDGNGFTGGANHDQTGVANAMLGALAFNGGHTQTCAVLAGSPAIGGDYSNATATDQRGVARASHTIGAYEYVASAPLVPVRTHVLWNNSDGRVMLWNVDASGGVTQNVFGPYDDTANVGVPGNTGVWHATALATGPDGMNHLLWNNPDGRVMLWTMDDSGNFTLAGYGPYTDDTVGSDPSVNKWHAVGVSVGADNTTHLLWDNTDGRMMLWNVDSAFNFTLAGFGPYDDTPNIGVPGNTAVWHAVALATGPDNISRIAWNNPDGRAMLWNVDSAFGFTFAGFGPYTDDSVGTDPSVNKWSTVGVSVGADNATHLLWGNTDRRMMLWDVDGSYGFTLAGFGPYTDDTVGSDPSVNLWSATGIATGGDNVSRVLWGNTDARMMLWDVDGLFNFGLTGYGPYTDILPGGALGGQWTATAVSAAP